MGVDKESAVGWTQVSVCSRHDDELDIVAVWEELDLVSAPALEARLAEVSDGRPRVVVDLTECRFCDLSAIKVLISARRRIAPHGGILALADPNGVLVKLLHLTQLDPYFPVFGSVSEAVDALSRTRSIHDSWMTDMESPPTKTRNDARGALNHEMTPHRPIGISATHRRRLMAWGLVNGMTRAW
jgi:anti-sigma B factor antagonist